MTHLGQERGESRIFCWLEIQVGFSLSHWCWRFQRIIFRRPEHWSHHQIGNVKFFILFITILDKVIYCISGVCKKRTTSRKFYKISSQTVANTMNTILQADQNTDFPPMIIVGPTLNLSFLLSYFLPNDITLYCFSLRGKCKKKHFSAISWSNIANLHQTCFFLS